jgi:PhnB protein
MFWGDRCGTISDPDGYTWMIATHKAEPTPQEMKKAMKEQARVMAATKPAGLP